MKEIYIFRKKNDHDTGPWPFVLRVCVCVAIDWRLISNMYNRIKKTEKKSFFLVFQIHHNSNNFFFRLLNLGLHNFDWLFFFTWIISIRFEVTHNLFSGEKKLGSNTHTHIYRDKLVVLTIRLSLWFLFYFFQFAWCERWLSYLILVFLCFFYSSVIFSEICFCCCYLFFNSNSKPNWPYNIIIIIRFGSTWKKTQ